MARQNKLGIRKKIPSPAQLFLTQMRCIVAGGLAGAPDSFRGIGAQWGNLANIANVAFTGNQETAASLHNAQIMNGNSWRKRTNLVTCVRRRKKKKDFELRRQGRGKGKSKFKNFPRREGTEVYRWSNARCFASKGRTRSTVRVWPFLLLTPEGCPDR